jgi:antirestriction protein ArdC
MPKTVKRCLTDEERAERRRADRKFTREAVERLRSSDGWQAWLATRRYFRRYSMVNQILIGMQCPGATHVAGFRAWLKLGYAVRRGAHAIRIWVPILPSRKALERWERGGSVPTERPRTRFRLGPVFDRAQVDPLPPPATPVQLDPPIQEVIGDELAPALPRLIEFASELVLTVAFEEMKQWQDGLYHKATGSIAIRQDLTVNAQVMTLVHELGHALLDAEPREGDPVLDYATEEMVVESVAFTVCGGLGLDREVYSILYLASWAERVPIETIERTAGLIDRLAKRIEGAAFPGEPVGTATSSSAGCGRA